MGRKKKAESNEQLTKKYPGIKDILGFLSYKPKVETKLRISTHTADENTMHFRGEHIDGEEGHIMVSEFPGAAGTKEQEVTAFDSEHKPIFCMDWHDRDDNWRISDFLVGDLKEKSSYLILATIYQLFETDEDYWKTDEGTYLLRDKPVGRIAEIQVFTPPKEGFTALVERTSVMTNVRLNMREMMRASLERETTYDQVDSALDRLIDRFLGQVYTKGLQEVIDASRRQGMSGDFGNVKLLSCVMAGRIMSSASSDR